ETGTLRRPGPCRARAAGAAGMDAKRSRPGPQWCRAITSTGGKTMTDTDSEAHKRKMQKLKEKVDARIAAADTERGVMILLTGNGKGKSSSAFGMVMRSLGYGYKVGVVQFIKGQQLSGEELYLRELIAQENGPQVDFYQMGTGFTWNTQDKSGDIAAAEKTWAVVEPMLRDDSYHLVVLDELTFMLSYGYLDEDRVLEAQIGRASCRRGVWGS